MEKRTVTLTLDESGNVSINSDMSKIGTIKLLTNVIEMVAQDMYDETKPQVLIPTKEV